MPQFSVEPNEHITFGVVYEDEHLAVVVKPARRVTQPGLGHERDTLLNGLFARWGQRLQNLGAARDFGLLHRLDRETSGLVLVGLRPRAYDALREQFEARTVKKFYWAVTHGRPARASGVVSRALAEVTGTGRASGRAGAAAAARQKGKKVARISPAGKPALTAYRVLEASETAALVECRPLTGRLHQVRVHLASLGAPVLGDDLYASDAVAHASPRLALHAHRVVFTHPGVGRTLDVRSAWPGDLSGLLRRVGLARPASREGVHELERDPVLDDEPGVGEDPASGAVDE